MNQWEKSNKGFVKRGIELKSRMSCFTPARSTSLAILSLWLRKSARIALAVTKKRKKKEWEKREHFNSKVYSTNCNIDERTTKARRGTRLASTGDVRTIPKIAANSSIVSCYFIVRGEMSFSCSSEISVASAVCRCTTDTRRKKVL